jgi:hypothetical protein
MQFKVIISRAMFIFNGIINGKAQLEAVRFIDDDSIHTKNNVLVVNEKGKVDFFLSGATPLANVSKQHCLRLAAAARFFGYHPGMNANLPFWFSVGSLEMQNHSKGASSTIIHA